MNSAGLERTYTTVLVLCSDPRRNHQVQNTHIDTWCFFLLIVLRYGHKTPTLWYNTNVAALWRMNMWKIEKGVPTARLYPTPP
jgi:hypothetical protein